MKTPEILLKKADELQKYYEDNYPALAPLTRQCFLNTIETAIKQLEDGSYFVITGDIPAMWLRDSSAQVRPYVRFAGEDICLQSILESIIEKEAYMVCLDPYANAFNESANGARLYDDDTKLNDYVWERKYEVDSLCAPVYLAYAYWHTTGINRIFTVQMHEMIRVIVDVLSLEQDHRQSGYFFRRYGCPETDTIPDKGKGRPVNVTGMTWSGFRPSDDHCEFNYLIPANMMAQQALLYAALMCWDGYGDEALAVRCSELAQEIRNGIDHYAVVNHPKYGKMYAYETDGFGNYILMDDANFPSLLALPYLDYCNKGDSVYQNTRRFVLFGDNPYYKQGIAAEGIGSPHTPEGYVWHIGIIMQALTSSNPLEIRRCLRFLSTTHAGTNYMHEAFNPDNPEEYTRPWFAWANSLLAELLFKLMDENLFGREK